MSTHLAPPSAGTRRLSLVTPSGSPTLGNLLGALRPLVAGQDAHDCFVGFDIHRHISFAANWQSRRSAAR